MTNVLKFNLDTPLRLHVAPIFGVTFDLGSHAATSANDRQ